MDEWLVVELEEQKFALPAGLVREMVLMPPVSRVPGAPPWVRGVMNLRGRVLPVLDLRLRLGMRSAVEEVTDLCSTLEARKQDHLRWLAELRASVQERRAFTLALDPTKCAFGRWFASYEPRNTWEQRMLNELDGPHRAIHAVGVRVEGLKETGEFQAAGASLDQAERTLAELLVLFERLIGLVQESRQEIATVVGDVAVAVDAALAVEHLVDVQGELAFLEGRSEPVILLEPSLLSLAA